jgi:acetyltransferase-like isoleucine patch superfamily enzyme
MRNNFSQTGNKGADGRTYIEGDWYSHGIPFNVKMAGNVYMDTAYGFAAFHSDQPEALRMENASGCYDLSSFIVGNEGRVSVGKFSVLNGTLLVCNKSIVIGDHCFIAWGSVITDTWLAASTLSSRRAKLAEAAADPLRRFPFAGESKEVKLEDNTWIGFGAVIMPGVTLGRGCIVGSKTIITESVPPYAVVVGDPPRIVKYLAPDDTEEAKAAAFKQYLQNPNEMIGGST